MNKLGKKGSTFHDTVPMLRQAGKSSAVSGESAENCVRHDGEDGEGRPSTPPHMKKYRLSTLHEPGKIVRHYGLADDPLMEGPFGRHAFSYGEEGVEDVIKTSHGEVADWKQAEGEKIYASSKREPLGRSWNPNGIQELVGDTHQFGVKIGATEMNKNPQAKRLIYPTEKDGCASGASDEENYHQQYVKTHGQYHPGEQRQRGYNWESAGIDKDTHAFGVTERHPYYDGVSKALNPLRDSEKHKESVKIVSKRQEDFKLATAEELGRCKHQGFGDTNVDDGHVYGVPSRRFEEWDVGKLIASQHDGKGIETADRDLGLSLRPGFRNRAPEDRVFGAPTIRTDIPGREVKSVADNNNYGNEPDAMSLVYPSTAAHRGVVDRDYIKPYEAAELRDLMDKAGVQLDDETFSKVFQMGSTMDSHGNPTACSVNSFRSALREVRRAGLGI